MDRKSSSGSFTSMIFRTIPSCWRTLHSDNDTEDDGGFRDFCSSRPSLAQRHRADRFSSLPVTSTCDEIVSRGSDEISRAAPHHRKVGVSRVRRPPQPRSGQFLLNDSRRLKLPPHKYLRYSASVQTFSVTPGPGLHGDSLQHARRPHSVDLGRVSSLRHYSLNRAKLSNEFRRAGIGTCLEGKDGRINLSLSVPNTIKVYFWLHNVKYTGRQFDLMTVVSNLKHDKNEVSTYLAQLLAPHKKHDGQYATIN